MRTIIYIGIIISLATGCTSVRKSSTIVSLTEKEENREEFIGNVLRNNITAHSFFIQRADVLISSESGNEKFVLIIKFSYPDTFLLSVRTKSGIEAARIFITDDTVLVNDRINRKLYFGRPDYFNRKYGIDASMLPVMLGDYVSHKDVRSVGDVCKNDRKDLTEYFKGRKIKYTFDCKRSKIIQTVIESDITNGSSEIDFTDFVQNKSGRIPYKIRFNYTKATIELKIKRIEVPWEGSVEFIPGKNYERVELL